MNRGKPDIKEDEYEREWKYKWMDVKEMLDIREAEFLTVQKLLRDNIKPVCQSLRDS